MNIFEPREIIEFAIQIEIKGERFYTIAAGKFSDKKVKLLFTNLAGQEHEHKSKFESILGRIKGNELPVKFDDEYYEYLQAYTKGKIFDKKLPKIKKPIDAIKFALDVEGNSILFYNDAKKFVLADEKTIIDDIIEQERQHFVRLSRLLKE